MKHKKTITTDLHRRHIYFSRINLGIVTLIFAVIGAIILINSLAAPNPNLPGDLNNDNTVNAADLSILLGDYNTTNSAADINGDGHINILDLSILLGHYGQNTSVALSGIYIGGSSAVPGFESWRSRPVDKVMFFPAGQTWSDISSVSGAFGWSQTPYKNRVVVAIKMLPCSDTTVNLQDGAAGAYNSYWKTAAQTLVGYGMSNAVVRVGWEFNQGWACWTIKTGQAGSRTGASAANYSAYFRQIVNTMRSVSGQNFTFLWNPSNGNQGVDSTTAYPGDSYVNYIGLDSYDNLYNVNSCTNSTFTNRWNNIVNSSGTFPQGLTFWNGYAKTHNKPLAFPEWGLWDIALPYCGGGDDTQYIQAMHDWISTHNVAYESYFDATASDGDHYIGPGATQFPKAAASYQQLFGG